jgi:digeranylgeranylglycerophospholipid reductase
VLVIIDVTGVYRHLAKVAQDAGAEVRVSTPARAVLHDRSMVVGCTVGDRAIRSRVLIDATGYRAALSKQAALHPGFQRFGVGAEYELSAPHCRADEAVLIVGSRYAPAGYAWVFPWGQGRVRVGVGVLHRDTRADPQEHLDLLIAEAHSLGIDLSQAERVELHTGLIPSEGLAGRFVTDGMMAVGDAAGQASLVVGEGIRLSLLAGQRAGTVAAEAVRKGIVTREALAPYEAWFRSSYQSTLDLGYAINQRLARYDDTAWDERIAIARQIPPELMLEVLQSNFPLSQVVRWILFHPRQWPRVLRFAIRARR